MTAKQKFANSQVLNDWEAVGYAIDEMKLKKIQRMPNWTWLTTTRNFGGVEIFLIQLFLIRQLAVGLQII